MPVVAGSNATHAKDTISYKALCPLWMAIGILGALVLVSRTLQGDCRALQLLRESCGIQCSRMQGNPIQPKLVSFQFGNYRERRNYGFCLLIWFKYVAGAKISCQMKNTG